MAKKQNNAQPVKWKLNIVDAIVLVVLVLAIVLLAVRLVIPGAMENAASEDDPFNGQTPEPYVITYYCDTSFKYVTDLLEVGQRVTDDTVKMNLGALIDYELLPSVYWEPNQSGQMVQTTRDDANAVVLTTICDAAVNTSDNATAGIRLYDGLALSVGHTLVIKVGDAKYYMACTGFQKLSESEYANMELPEYGHIVDEG